MEQGEVESQVQGISEQTADGHNCGSVHGGPRQPACFSTNSIPRWLGAAPWLNSLAVLPRTLSTCQTPRRHLFVGNCLSVTSRVGGGVVSGTSTAFQRGQIESISPLKSQQTSIHSTSVDCWTLF